MEKEERQTLGNKQKVFYKNMRRRTGVPDQTRGSPYLGSEQPWTRAESLPLAPAPGGMAFRNLKLERIKVLSGLQFGSRDQNRLIE